MKILIAPWSKKMRPDWKGAPEINPKNYPSWVELINLLKDHHIIQIGVEGEDKLVDDFRSGLNLFQLKDLLKEVDLFISVDSFLPHLAHTVQKTGIVLWGPSNPKFFGYEENKNLLKDNKYLRPDQFGVWEQCKYDPDAFVSPEDVKKVIDSFVKYGKNKVVK